MRAHGDFDQLGPVDLPDPSLRSDDHVVVSLEAAALNHLDLWTLHGLPGLNLEFPHILGGDGAGVVREVGSAVTQVQTGDRAPDFALQTLDGQPFALSDTGCKGHNVLLVFLRHLG